MHFQLKLTLTIQLLWANMETLLIFLIFLPIALSTSVKSMMFKGLPVINFTPFSSSNLPSAVCFVEKILHIKILTQFMQIECGLKCLDTDGCLTLRYKDGVCDLGGFHVVRDGSDSEMCYFNDG